MEFPGTGYSPGLSPRPRGESRRLRLRREEITLRHTYFDVCSGGSSGVTRSISNATDIQRALTNRDKRLNPLMMTCQGTTQALWETEPVSKTRPGTSVYMSVSKMRNRYDEPRSNTPSLAPSRRC